MTGGGDPSLSPDTRFCLALRAELQRLMDLASQIGSPTGAEYRTEAKQQASGRAARAAAELAHRIEQDVRGYLAQLRDGRR